MTAEPAEAVVQGSSSWTPVPPPNGGPYEGALAISRDSPYAKLPVIQNTGDAGLDLFTSTAVRIPAGQFRDVECGISLQLPVGYWARITGRSSTLRKRGLLVNEAVIDNGYTGPIYVGVWNLGRETEDVEVGERIAQLILHEIVRVPVVDVPGWMLISRDGRCSGGFGSTGR